MAATARPAIAPMITAKHDHTRLSRADDGAEPVRHFEMTAEQMHGA
jgi:hypothetical protein